MFSHCLILPGSTVEISLFDLLTSSSWILSAGCVCLMMKCVPLLVSATWPVSTRLWDFAALPLLLMCWWKHSEQHLDKMKVVNPPRPVNYTPSPSLSALGSGLPPRQMSVQPQLAAGGSICSLLNLIQRSSAVLQLSSSSSR